MEEIFLQAIECTVHRINNVRQTEMHTEEQLVPETSAYEVELAIEKLERHKPPGIYEITAELFKARGWNNSH